MNDKTTQTAIVWRDVWDIRPAPENEQVYRHITDESVQDLVKSIRVNGILHPLVITEDDYILSGHRRHRAGELAGLDTVPCIVHPIRRGDPEFLGLLVEANAQRIKGVDECIREKLARVGREAVRQYAEDVRRRDMPQNVGQVTVEAGAGRGRHRISAVKQPFAAAIRQVISDHSKFWPLSVRKVHYALLNISGLLRSTKTPTSSGSGAPSRQGRGRNIPYQNDRYSYQDLSDMLTRMRLSHQIPWQAITDDTRPSVQWRVWPDAKHFIDDQMDQFLKGYRRDLIQSQPAYLEIFAEKLTVESIIRPVCAEYGLPYMIGRGFSSIDARYGLAQRFRASGKQRMVLLILTDHDPDGEGIASSLVGSLREDFNLRHVNAIKVALTYQQVENFRLPHAFDAKPSSARYQDFVEKYGPHAWELEALDATALQDVLRGAIETVIDNGLFEAELQEQEEDRRQIIATRETILGPFRPKASEGGEGPPSASEDDEERGDVDG